jgi:putative membrane protein
MIELLARLAGNLAALWVASELFDGVTYGDEFGTLLLAAAVFTIVNWIVKPVVAILSIPLIILTLGIAYFFVNVFMLVLTEWLVGGFDVEGFWTFVGATIVIWVVNLVIAAALHDFSKSRARRPPAARDVL